MSIKIGNTIDTIQRSITRFVNQNNFEIRSIDDDDKEKDCQVGDTSKHSEEISTDVRICCHSRIEKTALMQPGNQISSQFF